MKDRLEERLRRLEIGRPDPALRTKVLRAAETAIPESVRTPAWYVEALLSAGIAATVTLLLLLDPLPANRYVPVSQFDQAEVKILIEELQLDQDLEDHFRARLNISERKLAAMRRAGHGHRTVDIEEF